MNDDHRNPIAAILIFLGFGLLGWFILSWLRGGYSGQTGYVPDRPAIANISPNTQTTSYAAPSSVKKTSTATTSGKNQCSEDSSGNEAPMLQSLTGTTKVVPVNGLGAARLRSEPTFGQNVVGCVRAGNLVSPTGKISGTWSEVKLADNTLAWIATNQLN